MKKTYSLFYASTILQKNSRLKQTGRFYTAQNLLNIAPRGSKQGVFWALTHTAVKNVRLVM